MECYISRQEAVPGVPLLFTSQDLSASVHGIDDLFHYLHQCCFKILSCDTGVLADVGVALAIELFLVEREQVAEMLDVREYTSVEAGV